MVAEDTVDGLELPARCKVSIVDKYFGYRDLSGDINKGTFPIQEVAVLLVMVGRADAMAKERNVLDEVQMFIHTVKKTKPETKIVITGPFPRALDDARRVRKLHAVGTKLRILADNSRVFYSFLVEAFTTPNGLNRQLVDEKGLTTAGKQILRSQILAFVSQHGLIKLYQDLTVTVTHS